MPPSSSSSLSEQLAAERAHAPRVAPAATPRAPGTFGRFLHDAMVALQREHPQAWEGVCAALRSRLVTLRVDAEIVPLRFTAQQVAFTPFAPDAHVELSTDRPTIHALVDGELSLESAVRHNRLRLSGAPADLIRFHEGLLCWLHGAVRSPSFPALLAGFRQTEGDA